MKSKRTIFLAGLLVGLLVALIYYGVSYEDARISRIESFLTAVTQGR